MKIENVKKCYTFIPKLLRLTVEISLNMDASLLDSSLDCPGSEDIFQTVSIAIVMNLF